MPPNDPFAAALANRRRSMLTDPKSAAGLQKITASAYSDESRRQAALQRTFERASQQAEQDAEKAAKAKEKADKEAADKLLRERNNALEAQFRREGRPFYLDADRRVQASQTDEQWQQKQAEDRAAKEAAAAAKAETAKNKVDTRWRTQQGAKINEAQAHMAENDDRVQSMVTERRRMVEARQREVRRLDEDIKSMSKRLETTFSMEEAQALEQQITEALGDLDFKRKRLRENEDALTAFEGQVDTYRKTSRGISGDLTRQETALPAQEAPRIESANEPPKPSPTPPPGATTAQTLVDRERTAAAAAPTPAAAHEVRADAILRHEDPQAWKAKQARLRAEADDDTLTATLDASRAAVETAQEEQQTLAEQIRQREEPLQARVAAHNAALAEAEGKPLSAAEAEQLNAESDRLNAEIEAARTETGPLREKLTLLQTDVGLDAEQYQETAKELQRRQEAKAAAAKQARAAELAKLEAQPGMAPFAGRLRALDTEAEARVADLRAQWNGEPPEEEVAALEASLAERSESIAKEMEAEQKRRHQAKLDLYTTWGNQVRRGDWRTPSGDNIDVRMLQEAQKLGLTEAEAREGLETFAALDWNSPRTLNPDGSPAWEDARVLPTGEITVNPKYLLDAEGYAEAVKAAPGKPEQKAKALAARVGLAERIAPDAIAELRKNDAMAAWLDKNTSGTPLERLDQFNAEMKKGGWLNAALMRLQGGAAGLGTGWLGTLAAATGWNWAEESAQYFAERSAAWETAAEAAGRGTTGAGRFASKVVGAVPSVLSSLAVGGLVGRTVGGLVGGWRAVKYGDEAAKALEQLVATKAGLGIASIEAGGQSFGSTFMDALDAYRKQGLPEEEARARALTPAVLAGLTTAGLTAALGGGVEKLLQANSRAGMRTLLRDRLREVGMDASDEFVEELSDQVAQGMIAIHTYAPDKDIRDVFAEGFEAGLIGMVLGGGMSGVRESADAVRNRLAPAAPATPAPAPVTPPAASPAPAGSTPSTPATPATGATTPAPLPPGVERLGPGHYRYTTPGGNTGEVNMAPADDAAALQAAATMVSAPPTAATPAATPAPATPAAAPAPVPEAQRAEEVATAEAEVDTYLRTNSPDTAPSQAAQITAARARALLKIGQGAKLEDLSEGELNGLGYRHDDEGNLERGYWAPEKPNDPASPIAWKKGQPPPDKTYVTYQKDAQGNRQLVILDAALQRLGQTFPAVRAAIKLDEAGRRQQIRGEAPPASAAPTPTQAAPAPTTSPTPSAAPAAGTAGGPALLQGAPAAVQPPAAPPATEPQLSVQEEERAEQIGNELARRGLPADEAARVAAALVRRLGVEGADYRLQMATEAFDAAMLDEGWSRQAGTGKRAYIATPATRAAATAATAPAPTTSTSPATPAPAPAPAAKPAQRRGETDGTLPGRPGSNVTQSSVWKKTVADAMAAFTRYIAKGNPLQVKAAAQALSHLEKLLDGKLGGAFDVVRLFSAEGGGGLDATTDPDGTRVLLVDPLRFLARGAETKRGTEAMIAEELIHTLAMSVMTDAQAIELVRMLQATPQGQALLTTSWQAYFAVPISDGTAPAEPPADMDDGTAYHVAHELIRQLVQDRTTREAFFGLIPTGRGLTTENAEVPKNLLTWLTSLLRRMSSLLRKQVADLPPAERGVLESYVNAIERLYNETLTRKRDLDESMHWQAEAGKAVQRAAAPAQATPAPEPVTDTTEDDLAAAADAELDAADAAAAAEAAAAKAKPQKKRGGPRLSKAMKEMPDVDNPELPNMIVYLAKHGKITRPSKDYLARMRAEGASSKFLNGDWDWMRQSPVPFYWSNLLFQAGNGSTIDTAILALIDEGYFPGMAPADVTPQVFGDKLTRTIAAYEALRRGESAEEGDAKYWQDRERQLVAFEEATAEGPVVVEAGTLGRMLLQARENPDAPRVAVQLKDKAGKLHRVEVTDFRIEPVHEDDFDPETYASHFEAEGGEFMRVAEVTLKDGEAFGVQQIDGDATLAVDAIEKPKAGAVALSAPVKQTGVAEISEIQKRAKADGTWLKAPNGNPTKLEEAQWLTARTTQFKQWFGDWEQLAIESAFAASVNAIASGDYDMTKPVFVGSTPETWLASGADPLPITMPPSMVRKVTQLEHDLPIETVRQIARAIKDPVFVFQSVTMPDALTVILDIKHKGQNVLVAVHLNRKQAQHEVNRIASIYDKSNPGVLQQWIKDRHLRYAHQKKSRDWFRSRGLQLPKEGTPRGNPNLYTDADIVNRTVSPDSVSKEVDENGEPLPDAVRRFITEFPLSASVRRGQPSLFDETELSFLGDRDTLGLGEQASRADAKPATPSEPDWVKIGKDDSEALPTQKEMEAGIKGAYDQLFTALETETTDRGVKLYSPERRLSLVDAGAHAAATSPLNDRPEPTEAQKNAGNYALGHVRVAGFDVSIENPAGSERKGTDRNGKPWSIQMRDHYGYIKGTDASDGDHLDVFIKPGTPADWTGPVFVARQVDPQTRRFDEYKVLMGYADATEATAAYRRNYAADWQGLDKIGTLTLEQFKKLASGGAFRKAGTADPKLALSAPAKRGGDALAPGWAMVDASNETAGNSAADVLQFEHVPDSQLSARLRDDLQALAATWRQDSGANSQDSSFTRSRVQAHANRRGVSLASFVRSFESATGKQVVWVDTPSTRPIPWRGAVIKNRPNTIFLHQRAQGNVLALIGHEWGHTLETQDPKLYRALQVQLAKHLNKNDARRMRRSLAEKGRYRQAILSTEITNNIIGDFFTEADFWREVEAENVGLLRQVLDSVMQWFSDLAASFKGSEFGTENVLTDLEAARKATAAAFAEAVRRGPYSELQEANDSELTRTTPLSASSRRRQPPTAAEVTRPANLIARISNNHLDKMLTAQVAAAVSPAVRILKKKSDDTKEAMLAALTGYHVAGEIARANRELTPEEKATIEADTRAGLKKQWDGIKRQIAPNSALPEDILAARREMNVAQAVGLEQALDVGKRSFKGRAKLLDIMVPESMQNPEVKRRMFLAMNPKIPSGITLADLTPEQLAVVQRLQKFRRDIGLAKMKAGRLSLDAFDEMVESTAHFYEQDRRMSGSWLNPFNFMHKLRSVSSQRATAWHIEDTEAKDKDGRSALVVWALPNEKRQRWRFKDEAHQKAFYEDFIRRQILAAKDERHAKKYAWMKPEEKAALLTITMDKLLAPGTMTAAERQVADRLEEVLRRRFQKRKPLSYDEHEKAGLIMDPFYSIARQLAEDAHDNALAEFFNHIAESKDYISDVQRAGYTQIPDSSRFGRLAGRFVRDDVAAEVMQLMEVPNVAMQMLDSLLAAWKWGKTVWNVGSHTRNVIGNIQFAELAGTNPLNPSNARFYADASRVLRDGGEMLQEMYDEGVLGGDYLTAELRQTLKSLLPDPNSILKEAKEGNIYWIAGLKERIARNWPRIAHPVEKFGRALVDKPAAAWKWEDDIYKAAAYLKSRSLGLNRKQAADHVRKWFPNYANLGKSSTMQALQRFLIPFLSFRRESLRIMKTAIQERPISFVFTLALPNMLTQLSWNYLQLKAVVHGLPLIKGVLSGLTLFAGADDDEEDKDRQNVFGHVLRGKAGRLFDILPVLGHDVPLFSVLLPTRDGNGGLQQYDLGNTMPFSDWLSTRTEGQEKHDFWLSRVGREMLTGNPFFALGAELAFNQDTFTRRRIWEDDMTTGEKTAAFAGHVASELTPPITPFVGTGYRMIAESLVRQPSKLTPLRSTPQAVLRVLGFDVRPADPNLYPMADDHRAEHGLDAGTPYVARPKDAASRARDALFEALIQPKPDIDALARELQRLDALGKPVRTMKDLDELFKSRAPETIMKNKAHQGAFIRGLAPESRRVMDAVQTEFQRARRVAPAALMEARKRLAAPKTLPPASPSE